MRRALHSAEGSDIYCGGFRAAASRRAGIIRYRINTAYLLSAHKAGGFAVMLLSVLSLPGGCHGEEKGHFTKLGNMG